MGVWWRYEQEMMIAARLRAYNQGKEFASTTVVIVGIVVTQVQMELYGGPSYSSRGTRIFESNEGQATLVGKR